MSEDKKNFAKSLTDNCKTHDEWLTVIRFGLSTLLEDQNFLFELISQESMRTPNSIMPPVDRILTIFDELGLHLTVKR